ncbi:glycosyltransferase family 2 protein [Candidatus Shapirobacteria bacterium CG10_big_fil_rev_8_21_14_0_10_38_14]|uniref:Glycosyltransferase family 2 protein n=1 Tax=Candidatus Shapirobacteria bacterium CG10_big_fil_rev_8_21_14_0_10_38_14 TaxID=1974483 RepID=A0A2M8L4Z5_9BACT|nr:MAG: glycosyltransferase family 2 protein [Candidatus Shapirobacteria bacterium CG10_big_fil_rev_8_21_14_0_10_38_14]
MKQVFVIILHFKGKEFTRQCLLSLRQLKTPELATKFVVVDNHSPEPIDDFKQDFPGVVFLKNKKNLGFAEGNNVGIKYALKQGADYVLILNNDTIVDKDLLVQLIVAAGKDGKVGIVAPKIYFAPGYEYHQAKYKPSERGKVFWYAGGKIDWQNVLCSHRGVDEVDKGQYDKQIATDFASGCAMLIKREVLEKIGFLDKRYFLYLEDVEFCQRAKRAGFKVIYHPKAKLWHFNASSSEVGGELHDYFITRNRLLFGMKYASWRTKLNLIQESVRLLLAGRPWQKVAIKDYYLKNFARGSWHD